MLMKRLRAGWLFLLGLMIVYAANLLAGGLASPAGSLRRFDVIYRPLLLLLVLAGFSGALKVVEGIEGSPLVAVGLARREGWLRDIWIGLLLGGGMVTIAVVVIAVAGRYTAFFSHGLHAAGAAVTVVFILATGAMAEEVSFRGYPFQRLIDCVGPTAAVLIMSGLFGAVHLVNPHASFWGFLNTALIGIVLSVAYLRTRLLWMSWGIHFAWNVVLGLVFGLPVSGLNEFAAVVYGRAEGPRWMTGGRYGIEASLIGAMVFVVGIAAVLVLIPPRAVPPDQPEPEPRRDEPGRLTGLDAGVRSTTRDTVPPDASE